MEIDLHSAIFLLMTVMNTFAVFYLLFLPTANEREAIIKSSAIVYLKFSLPFRNSHILRTSALSNTLPRETHA